MKHYIAEINIKEVVSEPDGRYQSDRRIFSEQVVSWDKNEFINLLAEKCGEITGKMVLV